MKEKWKWSPKVKVSFIVSLSIVSCALRVKLRLQRKQQSEDESISGTQHFIVWMVVLAETIDCHQSSLTRWRQLILICFYTDWLLLCLQGCLFPCKGDNNCQQRQMKKVVFQPWPPLNNSNICCCMWWKGKSPTFISWLLHASLMYKNIYFIH